MMMENLNRKTSQWLVKEGYESCNLLTLVDMLAKEQKQFHITVFINGPSNTESSFNPGLLMATSGACLNQLSAMCSVLLCIDFPLSSYYQSQSRKGTCWLLSLDLSTEFN
jgi:hypothetical protein